MLHAVAPPAQHHCSPGIDEGDTRLPEGLPVLRIEGWGGHVSSGTGLQVGHAVRKVVRPLPEDLVQLLQVGQLRPDHDCLIRGVEIDDLVRERCVLIDDRQVTGHPQDTDAPLQGNRQRLEKPAIRWGRMPGFQRRNVDGLSLGGHPLGQLVRAG